MADLQTNLNAAIGGLSLGNVIKAAVVFVICIIIVKLILKAAEKVAAKSKLDNNVSTILLKVLRIALYLITAMITVSELGINTTSLVAFLSVISLGITLAAESILSNFASGLVLLTTRPFVLGDYICVGDKEGTVSLIHLNHTEILAPDGLVVTIPNSSLTASNIVNCTRTGKRRIDFPVSVDYSAATDTVKKACLDALKTLDAVLDDPAPSVFITKYNANDIEFTIYSWVKSADYVPTKLSINEALRVEFEKNDIKFSYPHVNVHMIQ